MRILLEPVAKARARTVVSNGKVHSYTPSKTVDFEEQVKWLLKAGGQTVPLPKPVPVKVTLTFWLEEKSKLAYPTSRPDLDNLVKAVTDAANGILWEDDSQIVALSARKRWSPREGYIEIEVGVDV